MWWYIIILLFVSVFLLKFNWYRIIKLSCIFAMIPLSLVIYIGGVYYQFRHQTNWLSWMKYIIHPTYFKNYIQLHAILLYVFCCQLFNPDWQETVNIASTLQIVENMCLIMFPQVLTPDKLNTVLRDRLLCNVVAQVLRLRLFGTRLLDPMMEISEESILSTIPDGLLLSFVKRGILLYRHYIKQNSEWTKLYAECGTTDCKDCVICFVKFESMDCVYDFGCSGNESRHMFHADCIINFFEKSKTAKCPICRTKVNIVLPEISLFQLVTSVKR